MNIRCLLVLVATGTWGIAHLGHAAEPLRLEDAVNRALASNPTLAAEDAQAQAIGARAQGQALPTPYVIEGDVENVVGTGALSGFRSSETTLRIGRVLELGGKRKAREALGTAEINQQRNRIDAARIEIASRTATRFIEVMADQIRLAYAQDRVDQAERTRREVANWVAVARNPESDLSAAEIVVAETELEREHAEHELASARMTLAASWGSPDPDFDAVAGELETMPAIEPFEALVEKLPATPEQQAYRLEADTIAARKRVAEAAAKPDVNVSLGVRRMQALGDQGLVLSVAVPLGSRKRATYSIAESEAQLAALHARQEAWGFERHQALFEKYQELGHARIEAEALRETMIPKAEQALKFTRRGFESGRFSFIALAQAQNTVFELRKRSIEAAVRYHVLLIEVDRLTTTLKDITP